MTDLDYEFTLTDRIAKIQAINEQYDLEHNGYIAFSGGKDSCVLSHLIDLALPNNTIPRVYSNTGIEFVKMVQFVKRERERDNRIIILNQTRNIRKTLEQYGYPFKSKEHSMKINEWKKGSRAKFIVAYKTGNTGYKTTKFACPKSLLYQYDDDFKLNISNQCCYKLKKELQHSWEKENSKSITMTGMRNDEGGNRSRLTCTIFSQNELKKFHPLMPVSDKWEDEFIKRENVELCELYYPPYDFKRTGCKGCPFDLNLQEDLLTMKKLLPNEYKQCLILWKPVYDEYVRIGYRLSKDFYSIKPQYNIFDYERERNEKGKSN